MFAIKNDRSLAQKALRLGVAALAAAAALTLTACGPQNEVGIQSGGTTTAAETTAETTTAATTTATTTTTPHPDGMTTGWSTDSVNIRTGPGTEYYAIGGLHVGEQVTILGKEGDWYQISFANGPDGVGYVNAQYISATLVTTTVPPATAPETTTTAAQ